MLYKLTPLRLILFFIGAAVIYIVIDDLTCRSTRLSHDVALEIANWKINQQEQKRNPNSARRSSVKLVGSGSVGHDGSWTFEYATDDARCRYLVNIFGCGTADIGGITPGCD